MNIRQVLGIIATLDEAGNKPGSNRDNNAFTNTVADLLRNIGTVIERPNGANGYPSFSVNEVNFQIKTTKSGRGPMWNESYVRPDSVLIIRLPWGIVVVHGSLITDQATMDRMVEAKDFVAKHLREVFPDMPGSNFQITGGRIQFKDNIDWVKSQKSFLDETIKILEGLPGFKET